MEQELLTLPEDLSSPLVISGVRVTRFLVLHECFVDRCLSFGTVNQVMVATVKFRSEDFNFTKLNPWFSSFLVSCNPLSMKS
jgi:hypothetical protein